MLCIGFFIEAIDFMIPLSYTKYLSPIAVFCIISGGIYSYIRSDKKGKKRFLKILAFCLLGALVIFLILCYKFDLSIF